MNCLRTQCVPLHVCYQSPPCHVSVWVLKADAKLSCLCVCGKSGREHPPFACDGQALSPSLMDCVCWITRMLWYLHQSDCYNHGVDTLGTQDGDKDLMVVVSVTEFGRVIDPSYNTLERRSPHNTIEGIDGRQFATGSRWSHTWRADHRATGYGASLAW